MTMIAVSTAVFDLGYRLLCVRQPCDQHMWSLPGGCPEVVENPVSGMRRKLREETGPAAQS